MIARKRESDSRRLEIFWKLLPHVFTRNKSTGWTQDIATHQLVISSDLLPNDWHNYNKMVRLNVFINVWKKVVRLFKITCFCLFNSSKFVLYYNNVFLIWTFYLLFDRLLALLINLWVVYSLKLSKKLIKLIYYN